DFQKCVGGTDDGKSRRRGTERIHLRRHALPLPRYHVSSLPSSSMHASDLLLTLRPIACLLLSAWRNREDVGPAGRGIVAMGAGVAILVSLVPRVHQLTFG